MEIPIDQILTQLLIMAVTGVASALGGWLKGQSAERRKRSEETNSERDSIRAMLRLLLYFRLKDLFDKHVVGGEGITSAEKHEIEELYSYYHDTLNGNSEGTRMYNELMALRTE